MGSKPATPEVPLEHSTSTEPDSVTPPEFDFELSLGLSFYLAYHVYQLYLTFTKKVDDKTEKAITEDTTRKTKNNTTKMTSPLLLLMTLAPILPTTHSLPLGSTLSLLLPYPFLALGIQALLFLSILLLFISIRTAVCAMQILAPSALERCPTPATKITTINSLTKTGFRNSPYSLTAAPIFAISFLVVLICLLFHGESLGSLLRSPITSNSFATSSVFSNGFLPCILLPFLKKFRRVNEKEDVPPDYFQALGLFLLVCTKTAILRHPALATELFTLVVYFLCVAVVGFFFFDRAWW